MFLVSSMLFIYMQLSQGEITSMKNGENKQSENFCCWITNLRQRILLRGNVILLIVFLLLTIEGNVIKVSGKYTVFYLPCSYYTALLALCNSLIYLLILHTIQSHTHIMAVENLNLQSPVRVEPRSFSVRGDGANHPSTVFPLVSIPMSSNDFAPI